VVGVVALDDEDVDVVAALAGAAPPRAAPPMAAPATRLDLSFLMGLSLTSFVRGRGPIMRAGRERTARGT
jgi:hypothetical protein